MFDYVVGRLPGARLAENDDRRSTEAEHRLLLAALERHVAAMHLQDPPHLQRADLDEGDPAEMPGFQDVDLAFVAEQDVGLVGQRLPIHRPQPPAMPLGVQRLAIVEIMRMVIVQRRQPGQDHRAAPERLGAPCVAEDLGRGQGVALDGVSLAFLDFLPAHVARFGEGAHVAGFARELADAGLEAALEEIGVGAIDHRFEIGHLDLVLADEGLDRAHAEPRVVIGRQHPVIGRMGLEPLVHGPFGVGFIGGRAVLHIFLDQFAGLAVPDRQRTGLAHISFPPSATCWK